MRIITASNKTHENHLKTLLASADKVGYKIEVFDLDELGIGEDDLTGVFKSCSFKPNLLKDIKEFTVWVDDDCIFMDRIDEVEGDYDIGVTIRRESERNRDKHSNYSGWLNAGVVFVNNTSAAKRFVKLWIDHIPETETKTDQEALSDLVRKGVDGVRIKQFKTDEYNWFYFPEEPKVAKIIHLKTDVREKYAHLYCNT